jgi:hypothetical protein
VPLEHELAEALELAKGGPVNSLHLIGRLRGGIPTSHLHLLPRLLLLLLLLLAFCIACCGCGCCCGSITSSSCCCRRRLCCCSASLLLVLLLCGWELQDGCRGD